MTNRFMVKYNISTPRNLSLTRVVRTILTGTLIVGLLIGCASKKKGKQGPSAARQAYENMTGYYNAYFNANELLQLSYLKLKENYKEDYNDLLPLYPMQNADISPVKADLDKAIDKLIKNINNHELSHWRDDSYVMIGEIQDLKKDYETAEETMEYFIQEFDPLKAKNRKTTSSKKKKKKKKRKKSHTKHRKSKHKKKKKKDETAPTDAAVASSGSAASAPSEGFLFWKHTPAFKRGMILMSHIYVERGKPTLAKSLLRRLREDPGLTKEERGQIGIVQADMYIRQDQPAKAISILQETTPLVKSKDDRARYWFVIGQLLEREGHCDEATKAFEHVIKLRRNYDMEFHALLHKIKCNAEQNTSDGDKTIRKLKKLLKDEKNEEFAGHIYDAMATVELGRQNTDAAKSYYDLAIKNTNDNHLKEKVYLHLANFFLDNEQFLEAKLYLDSTLNVMDKSNPSRVGVEKKRDHITEIANQISIIREKDSLLVLSKMSEEEKLKIAKELEAKAKAAEAAEKESEVASNNANTNLRLPGNIRGGGIGFPKTPGAFQLRGNNFFAYNAISIRKGKTAFKRTWGIRKLEDHWRRSHKDIIQDIEDSADTTSTTEEEVATTTEDRNLIRKYLPGIPGTEKQKQQVRQQIEDAYYLLGKLYRDKLDNCQKSTGTLETLLSRFPKTNHEAGALYYLYLCALDNNEPAKARDHKLTLVQKYPNSLYSKVLTDPDFVKKWLAEKHKEEIYYKETYDLFTQAKYADAKSRIEAFNTLKEKNDKYDAKFALLGAMIEGHQGKKAYIKALKDVIAKYPNTPETIRAKEIMRFLQGDDEAFSGKGTPKDNKYEYSYIPDKTHYALVIIHDLKGNSISKVKIDISQYNRKHHPDINLKMTTANLDISKDIPLILIRRFKNAEEAMKYYKGATKDLKSFIKTDVNFDLFVASQKNYRNIVRKKSVASFRPFFEHFYLKK